MTTSHAAVMEAPGRIALREFDVPESRARRRRDRDAPVGDLRHRQAHVPRRVQAVRRDRART